jgi:hypothetical protein
VAMLTELAVDVSGVLARNTLNEPAERFRGHLHGEVHFVRRPAECVNVRAASTCTTLHKLRKCHVIRGFEKDLPALVAVENDVVRSARNVLAS